MKAARSFIQLMFLVLGLAGAIVCPVVAQVVNGKIVGVVRDQQGAAIPNTQIVATSVATGPNWRTTSNPLGEYVFPTIPAGEYALAVSHQGFKSITISNVHLQVLQTEVVAVNLAVGAVREDIHFDAQDELLDMRTSDSGSVIDSRQIEALPLNGGDVLQLVP
jgi:hypothetical protein